MIMGSETSRLYFIIANAFYGNFNTQFFFGLVGGRKGNRLAHGIPAKYIQLKAAFRPSFPRMPSPSLSVHPALSSKEHAYSTSVLIHCFRVPPGHLVAFRIGWICKSIEGFIDDLLAVNTITRAFLMAISLVTSLPILCPSFVNFPRPGPQAR